MMTARWFWRRLSVIAFPVGICLLNGACDGTPSVVSMSTTPDPSTIRLAVPDPAFKLSPQERVSIRPGFDVDALERLLAAVEPAVRPMILSDFQAAEPGEPGTVLVKMGDPALQPLLDEVWAPIWERYPEMIDNEVKDFPGREIARKRLGVSVRPQ